MDSSWTRQGHLRRSAERRTFCLCAPCAVINRLIAAGLMAVLQVVVRITTVFQTQSQEQERTDPNGLETLPKDIPRQPGRGQSRHVLSHAIMPKQPAIYDHAWRITLSRICACNLYILQSESQNLTRVGRRCDATRPR